MELSGELKKVPPWLEGTSHGGVGDVSGDPERGGMRSPLVSDVAGDMPLARHRHFSAGTPDLVR